MNQKQGFILTPRSAHTVDLGNGYGMRVVDMPEWYGGTYDLSSGKKTIGGKEFKKSAWAFACIQIRGQELANLPWRLVDSKGNPVTSHIVINMLRRFGRESNYSDGMAYTEADMLLGGRAFWLRDVDLIQRLNPSTISLIADRNGIQGFRQTIDGTVVNEFAREDVVYFREYNPDSEIEPGPAVMEIIKKAVAIEYESGLYMEAFFKNDATPALLLTTDQTVQETDMDKLLAFWNKTFRGAKKAQKVGLLDKGIKAQILSHNMKEIAMVELRDQARNDICVGMRVPKILVGSMVDSTYANASEARRFLLEDVIIPRSKSYADAINADLVHVIDPEVTFEFVAGDIPILQEGLGDKWKRLKEAVELGAITLEFARSQMGWPVTAAPKPSEMPQTPPEEPSSPIEGEGPGAQAARSWRKKALKAVKDGKSANVLFDTDAIPSGVQYLIRSRLNACRSLEEVNEAFRLPSDTLTPHQTFNIDVHVPAAEAPTVHVESPTVTVAAPEVHVAAPQVEVKVPRVSHKTEETKVVRNKQTGNLDSTVTSARYDYEK